MSKRIIVTGATGGIGRELVLNLAGKGHLVAAIGRSEELLEELRKFTKSKTGTEITCVAADFSSDGFEGKVAASIGEAWGAVDVLINNAGSLINKAFLEMKAEDVEQQFRANYTGPYLLIQSLIPLLKKSVSAHVVNIGSMGGFQGSAKFPGLSAYSSAKGALAILSECLAAEFSGDAIAFNCLALGSADTEMLRQAHPGYRSPMKASDMAAYIADFALEGHRFYNGKVLPVAALSV